MKKTVTVRYIDNKDKSAIHLVKVLGLAGGIENSHAGKLILDFSNKEDIVIDIDEKNVKKVMELFTELNIQFEIKGEP